MKRKSKPCSICPFLRESESNNLPEGTNLDQLITDVHMDQPCMCFKDSKKPCNGASIYRANTGRKFNQMLPEDHGLCFSNVRELRTHHKGELP